MPGLASACAAVGRLSGLTVDIPTAAINISILRIKLSCQMSHCRCRRSMDRGAFGAVTGSCRTGVNRAPNPRQSTVKRCAGTGSVCGHPRPAGRLTLRSPRARGPMAETGSSSLFGPNLRTIRDHRARRDRAHADRSQGARAARLLHRHRAGPSAARAPRRVVVERPRRRAGAGQPAPDILRAADLRHRQGPVAQDQPRAGVRRSGANGHRIGPAGNRRRPRRRRRGGAPDWR